jgi:hypothetical protein
MNAKVVIALYQALRDVSPRRGIMMPNEHTLDLSKVVS